METRRTFIKGLASAGIAAGMPDILFIQKSSQLIRLIVRADDMGNSWGVTLGIIRSYREGIVTSASLMPTGSFFEESVKLCKENPELDVGVHVTLIDVDTKSRSVLSPELVPSLLNPEGFFHETLEKLNNANPKVEEMEKEIRAQVKKARASGVRLSYIDNHMSVPDAAREIINKVCMEEHLIIGQMLKDGSLYGYKRLGHNVESWPRHVLPDGRMTLYAAPSLSPDKKKEFFDLLTNLEPGENYMVNFHPGMGEPERISITELLCAAETKEIIKRKNIRLVSYYDVWKDEYGKGRKK
jgi:chitin disaccharide deacetylase